MKLTGVNLNTLPASAKSAIENNAKANVASSFGVPLDTISVILQQGSVNIVIKVLNPPADNTAFDPESNVDPDNSPATSFLSSFADAVANDPSLDIPGFEPVFPNPADFAASAVTAPVSLPPITLDSTSFEIPITTGTDPVNEPSLEDLTPTDKAALIQQTITNVTNTFNVNAADVIVDIFEDANGAIIIKTFVENAETGTDAAQALNSDENMSIFATNVGNNLATVKANSTNETFRTSQPPTIEAPAPAAPVVVNVPAVAVVAAVAVVDDSGSTTPVTGDVSTATASIQQTKNDAVASTAQLLTQASLATATANSAVVSVALQVESAQAAVAEANEASAQATTAANEAQTLLEDRQAAVTIAQATTVSIAETAAASLAVSNTAAAEQQATNEAATNSQSGTSSSTAQEEPVFTINSIPQRTRDQLVSSKIQEILANDTTQTLTESDIVVTLSVVNNEVILNVIISATQATALAVQEATGIDVDRFLIPFVGRGIKVIPNASSSMGIADKRRAAIAAGKKNNSVANNPTPSAQFSFLRGRLRRARSSGAVAPRKTNYR